MRYASHEFTISYGENWRGVNDDMVETLGQLIQKLIQRR
jgi:hypothetical protein